MKLAKISPTRRPSIQAMLSAAGDLSKQANHHTQPAWQLNAETQPAPGTPAQPKCGSESETCPIIVFFLLGFIGNIAGRATIIAGRAQGFVQNRC